MKKKSMKKKSPANDLVVRSFLLEESVGERNRNAALKTLLDAPQYLSMFTIYEHPKDYPDKFVVREFVIKPAGPEPSQHAKVYDTLDDARLPLIRRGLVCLTRQPEDEPQIVETWL